MSLRRTALWLVLASGLLGILGQWGGQPLPARLWQVPAGLLLLGLAYEAWWVGRSAVWLQAQTEARWFLGRPMPLQLRLRQSLRRTISIELLPVAPAEVTLGPAAGTAPQSNGLAAAVHRVRVSRSAPGVVELTGTARRLGRFEWPPCPVRIGGVLGLAWWSRSLSPQLRVQVLPELLRDEARGAALAMRGTRSGALPGRGTEILQLREYRSGDPPRAIDWKATARLGRPVSRDFSEDQQLQIVLAVDAGRASALAAGDTDRLALYANVACRLAQRAALLEDRVGLLIYADQPLVALPPAQGTTAVARLRACLADARVQDGEANPLLAALRVRALARHRSLVILLTSLDEAAVLGELSAAARLLLPKHLPLIAAVHSERVSRLAVEAVEDTLQAYRALAAQEFDRAVARNLQALRALGATAVLAAPQQLDRAVIDSYLRLRERRRVG